jgi:hypothetical protein
MLFKTAPAEIMQPPAPPAAKQVAATDRKTPGKSAFERRSFLLKGK